MSDNPTFRDLIGRVRAGDKQAEADLEQRYGKVIKAMARPLLTGPELRRLLSSSDVCQSVLRAFFQGARAGRFELDEPEQLRKLFAKMVRHNVITYVRKLETLRRKGKRVQMDGELVDPRPSPGRVAAGKEELERICQRLPPKRRQIVELVAAGHTWPEIAAAVGGSPDALRVWYHRWVEQVREGQRPEE